MVSGIVTVATEQQDYSGVRGVCHMKGDGSDSAVGGACGRGNLGHVKKFPLRVFNSVCVITVTASCRSHSFYITIYLVMSLCL